MALPIRERHVAPARERRRNRRGQRTHPPALTTFGQPEPSGESTRRFVAPTRPLAMRLTNRRANPAIDVAVAIARKRTPRRAESVDRRVPATTARARTITTLNVNPMSVVVARRTGTPNRSNKLRPIDRHAPTNVRNTHQLAPAMTAEQSSGTAQRRHRSGATSADHPEQSGAGVSERRMKAGVDATGGGGTIRMCKGRVGRGGPTLVRDLGDASEQWTSHTNGTGAWKHGQSGRSSRRMVIREGPWPERKSPEEEPTVELIVEKATGYTAAPCRVVSSSRPPPVPLGRLIPVIYPLRNIDAHSG